MRKSLIPALVVLASAGLLALSGCSAPASLGSDEERATSASQAPDSQESSAASDPANGEQSVADACVIASKAMLSVQSEISGALTKLGTGDVESAVTALESFESSLGEAVEQVTNPEVDAVLGEFQSSFAEFNDLLASAQTGAAEAADQAALQAASADLQTSAQGVSGLCG